MGFSDEPSEFEDDFFPGDFIGLKEKSVNVDAGSDVECGTVIVSSPSSSSSFSQPLFFFFLGETKCVDN